MSGNDKKQLFDDWFNEKKDDPHRWGSNASNLKSAAEALFKVHRDWCDPETGEPINHEHERVDAPATMLYGCAMENMIKAYLIKKYGSFETAMGANENAWKRHQIPALADETGLTISDELRLLLRTLESFVVWAGRYPIPLKRHQFTLPEQFDCSDDMVPSEIQFRGMGIRLLDEFFKRMEDAVFADLWACIKKGSSKAAA